MSQARQEKIESYGRAYAMLIEALQQFPPEMWQFKPSAAEWSIHELIVHIADSEANSYGRGRKAIVEPGSTVMAYDEAQWAKTLNYHEQSTADALELFKWLRHTTYQLLRHLPEPVWSQTIEHPENGTMTLEGWLEVYERHIPEHIAQMQRTFAAWQGQRA
jgi:uncharacterized damage-inducible protein DinB